MDLASVIGLAGVFVMVVFGILSGGGSFVLFFDIPSIFITLGGAMCAVIFTNPLENMMRLPNIVKNAFFVPKYDPAQVILTLVSFSEKARREGLLALEDDLEEVSDAFLRKGVQLVVDGTEPELVRNIMSSELGALSSRHESNIKIVEDFSALTPAFGMIGTLIGLVIMMKNLGGDKSAIGAGMATALITTFYGAVLAYGVFTPVSEKLKKYNAVELTMKEIIIEGTLSIQAGDNPRIVQEKLVSFFSPAVRKKISEQLGDK